MYLHGMLPSKSKPEIGEQCNLIANSTSKPYVLVVALLLDLYHNLKTSPISMTVTKSTDYSRSASILNMS